MAAGDEGGKPSGLRRPKGWNAGDKVKGMDLTEPETSLTELNGEVGRRLKFGPVVGPRR